MPEKSIDEVFIGNLNKYLSAANMTYSELAEKLNISKSTVSMWVSKKSLPRMEILDKIADLFGVSTANLLADRESFAEVHTIAAHFDGDEYTEDEINKIREFAAFVKSQRKTKFPDKPTE